MKKVVIDFETTGLSPQEGSRIFLAGMETEDGKVFLSYRPGFKVFKSRLKEKNNNAKWERIKRAIENKNITKICHNAKFELKMCDAEGWKPAGIFHDTMLLSYVNNEYEGSLSLEYLSKKYLDEKYHKSGDEIKKWLAKEKRQRRKQEIFIEPNYSDVPEEIMLPYLENDLDSTMLLYWLYEQKVESEHADIYEIERKLIPAVVNMENTGVLLDIPYLEAAKRNTKKKLDTLEKELYTLAGKKFNPNAPGHVASILIHLGIELTEYTDKGNPKTGKEVLERLNHPFADTMLKYKAIKKIFGTYLVPIQEMALDNVLYCNFWQFGQDQGIKTSRFSSSNPNLQNVPVRESGIVRRAFIPRPCYVLLFVDYAQIEARIFAHYADDKIMKDAFFRGIDIYETDMVRIWGSAEVKKWKETDKVKFKYQRYIAKTIRLAIQYGMGVQLLANKIDYTYAQAKKFKADYLRTFPSVKKLMNETETELLRNGFIEDIFGRHYHVPRDLCYKGVNAKIQGTAATVMKKAIIETYENVILKEDVNLLMTIHDELIFEIRYEELKKQAMKIKTCMEDHKTFDVPMLVDLEYSKKSWADKKELLL